MNNNQKRRDEIIDKNFLTDDYRGGIRRFDNINAKQLGVLIKEDFADKKEKQNLSLHQLEGFTTQLRNLRRYLSAISLAILSINPVLIIGQALTRLQLSMIRQIMPQLIC